MGAHTCHEVYDISVLLGESNTNYPGDTPYSRSLDTSIKEGASYSLSTLVMSAHAGTHIDAPAHFIENGMTIDLYPPSRFILKAAVIPIKDSQSIKPGEIQGLEMEKGEAILFQTRNSKSGLSRSGRFCKDYVYLTEEASEICISSGASMVGIDYASIERYESKGDPVHHRLLENDVLILEGLDLGHVPPGRYNLYCLPLLIKGGEASPVRAILCPVE
ncbi:MAG TPA: cyclase family protein [Methanotrichaceae archaeon]|nr:cyclase family protein [Methanotrichaceae archaeon]